MAIGQNLSTNLYCPNSSQYPFVLSVSWSETGTNVGGNVSYISASGSLSGQYVAFDGAPYTSYLELYWYDDRTNSNTLIGRSAFTSCGMGYGTRTVTGTAQPSHKNDGTLNGHVWVRFSAGSGSGGWSPASRDYGGSNIALTTIPRQSSISSMSGSELGSAVTVNISRNSSSFTHQVWYSFNSSPWVGVTSNAATSVTFTPPLDLGSYISNTTAGTLTVYIDTMNGSTKIGNTISKSITLSMPSWVVPGMNNPTATRVDNGVPSSWGIYVKNKSKVTISIGSAWGAYGSWITSYSITGHNLNSGSSSATSGVLSSSGTLTYTCRVTDSRGRSASKTVSISVVDYYNPSLKVSADRCNSSGVIIGDGTYLRVVVNYGYSSVSGKNSISSKSVTCNSVSNTTFGDNAAFTLAANCSIGSKYTLTATVRDALGNSASASVEIPTAARIINIRQNKKGIAFGKFSEKDAFEVAMPAYFEKNVDVSGEIAAKKLTADYTFQRGYLTSPSQSGETNNMWTKMASFDITGQYGDANGSFVVEWVGNGEGLIYRAEVTARVKQQNPMGQAPYTSLYVDGINVSATNFALVKVTNTSSVTSVQLWARNFVTWSYMIFYYVSSSGNVTLNSTSAYQAALPSGLMQYGTDRLLNRIYPVGSIYISATGTNPSTFIGGTWVEFGQGRTLVGVNTSDNDFKTVEKTGGEKTHKLTTTEMPSHTHTAYSYISANEAKGYGLGSSASFYDRVMVSGNHTTSSSGGNRAHNNVQPYITVYFWKRTA